MTHGLNEQKHASRPLSSDRQGGHVLDRATPEVHRCILDGSTSRSESWQLSLSAFSSECFSFQMQLSTLPRVIVNIIYISLRYVVGHVEGGASVA